ncbi:hypothetical protein S231_04800 [Candidatus Phytoplasma solani]|nr:hypothetical protein S231_04800 [Candidatus Phytoplasma solani]
MKEKRNKTMAKKIIITKKIKSKAITPKKVLPPRPTIRREGDLVPKKPKRGVVKKTAISVFIIINTGLFALQALNIIYVYPRLDNLDKQLTSCQQQLLKRNESISKLKDTKLDKETTVKTENVAELEKK